MSKRKRFNNTDARGRQKTKPFIKLVRYMAGHPAWRALTPEARVIYIELRRRFNGANNGEISLSCREAAEIAHCGKSSAAKHLQQLVDYGFIKPNWRGIFTYRMATTWILSNEMYGNQPPTNDWKHWQPQTKNKA